VVGLKVELPKAQAGIVKDLIRTAWQAKMQPARRKR